MAMGTLAWKVIGTGSAIAASLAATKLVNVIWAKAGQDDINPKNPHAPLAKAVAYAAATGLAVGVARTFTQRRAAAYYEKSAGHLPADVADEPA
jgi:Protein of unknown function (DUF4235)